MPYREAVYEQGGPPAFSRAAWSQARAPLAARSPLINLPFLEDARLARPLSESKVPPAPAPSFSLLRFDTSLLLRHSIFFDLIPISCSVILYSSI